MLTLDSGSVSLSRSARGDSVQKIWLVGRHSDPFTLENTVFRCVTLPPLGMFPKFWLIPLTRTFWSLRVTLHYLSLLAFVLWSQQGTHKNLFCVNAFLCCSSVSSPMPAIYSCRAIRRHFLRLSDCLTNFTLQFFTLPLFLMVFTQVRCRLFFNSAAAAGNLISASLSSSTHESSDLNSSTRDALFVAHLPFLHLLWVHLFVLTICLVLWCSLLSFRGARLWPSTREKFQQYKFSHSLCQVLFCLFSMRLVESIAEHISFCLFSYSSIRCARPLLRHMRFMVTSVLRRSFNSRKRAQFIHGQHLGQRGSRFRVEKLSILCWGEEFRSLTAVLFSGLRHSPTLRQDICQFFRNQIAFTVSQYVLGMYALFDAHETSHCSFSVSQVLCTNWRFLLSYSW